MFKIGKTYVTTDMDYIIECDAYHTTNNPGNIEEIDMMQEPVDTFEVDFQSCRHQGDLVQVFVRPIGSYKGYFFHAVKLVMKYEEASCAYDDLQTFISRIWNKDPCIFNQNPLQMFIFDHNTNLLDERNAKAIDYAANSKEKLYSPDGVTIAGIVDIQDIGSSYMFK
jgi:hypothetical protein